MQIKRIAALVALVGSLFAQSGLLHACAVCLTGADGAVADAYDWSVLFLMIMPYLVVGSIAAVLAYAYRRAAANNKENETDSDPSALRMAWDQEEKQR